MKSKVHFLSVFAIVSILLAVLLAACSPVAAGSSSVPVTAATPASPSAAPATTNANSAAPAVSAPTASAPAASAPAASAPAASAAAATANTSGESSSSGSGITYTLVPEQSQASFTVTEQLVKKNFPSDAVGTTNAIAGSITMNPDGTIDQSNSKFTVDLFSLKTDSGMRDNYVRRNILETNQYPQAVFIPTQVSGLPATIPQSGNVSFKVTGNMTIHGTTKPITWDVTGTVNNGTATGKATTSFTFEDFGLNQPRVPVVLSVVDKITLNVNIALQKSGG